jgi:hypothetical protein
MKKNNKSIVLIVCFMLILLFSNLTAAFGQDISRDYYAGWIEGGGLRTADTSLITYEHLKIVHTQSGTKQSNGVIRTMKIWVDKSVWYGWSTQTSILITGDVTNAVRTVGVANGTYSLVFDWNDPNYSYERCEFSGNVYDAFVP